MLRMSLLYTILLIVSWLLNALPPIARIDLPAWLLVWAFVVAVCLFEVIRRIHRKTIPIHRELIGLVLFFLMLTSWRLVQSIWSVDSVATIEEMVKTILLGMFVVTAYMGLSSMNTTDLERLAGRVITAALSISCGAYFYLLVREIGDFTYFGLQDAKQHITLFGGSNVAGAMILIFGTWNWSLVLSAERRLRRLGFLNLALALVLLLGIGSRTAIGGFLFAGTVMLIGLLWKKRRRPLPWLLVGLVGGAILSLIFFAPVMTEANVDEQFQSMFRRMDMWHLVWEVLSDEHWLLGAGVGTNADLTFYTAAGVELRGGVHNALLQTWLEEGLLGLSLYILLFVWLVKVGLFSPYRSRMALVAVTAGVFMRNLGESNGLLWGLLNNYLVFASWFVVVHLLICCRKEHSQQLPRTHSKPESSQLRLPTQSGKLRQVYADK